MKYKPKDVQLVFEDAEGTRHVLTDWAEVPEITVKANPNDISLDEAFAIFFERYADAMMELSKK